MTDPTPPSLPPRERDFRELLQGIAHTRGSIVPIFADFCRISACVVAMQTREDEYMTAITAYSRDDLNIFATAFACLIDEMERHPFADILGPYYTEISSAHTRDLRGEFYTPPAIEELMARLSFDAEAVRKAGHPVSVSDPASGSGGLILACARRLKPDIDLLRATLQDLNPTACDMAYINTTLWGIPAEIILGNTLTAEITQRWTNLHWHRVGEGLRREFARLSTAISEPNPASSPAPPFNDDPDQPEFGFRLEP